MHTVDRSAGYRVLAAGSLVLTLLLVAMGAIVRSTGSGLGCPDWPLCHGGLLPFDDRAATIEWTHRLMASAAGAAILALAAWTAWRGRSPRSCAVGVTLAAVLAGQAYLGREAVVRELPREVVALHLASALLLVALLTWLAVTPAARRSADTLPPRWRITTLVLAAAVLAVVGLGMLVVVNGAALACSTWPGCAEGPLPLLRGGHAQDVQWLHRLVALVGLGVLALSAWLARRWQIPAALRVLAAAILALYLAQAAIGAVNVWWALPTTWRAVHVLMANVLWMLAVAMVRASWASHGGVSGHT